MAPVSLPGLTHRVPTPGMEEVQDTACFHRLTQGGFVGVGSLGKGLEQHYSHRLGNVLPWRLAPDMTSNAPVSASESYKAGPRFPLIAADSSVRTVLLGVCRAREAGEHRPSRAV